MANDSAVAGAGVGGGQLLGFSRIEPESRRYSTRACGTATAIGGMGDSRGRGDARVIRRNCGMGADEIVPGVVASRVP